MCLALIRSAARRRARFRVRKLWKNRADCRVDRRKRLSHFAGEGQGGSRIATAQ
jgi:hypothetical protein